MLYRQEPGKGQYGEADNIGNGIKENCNANMGNRIGQGLMAHQPFLLSVLIKP